MGEGMRGSLPEPESLVFNLSQGACEHAKGTSPTACEISSQLKLAVRALIRNNKK